ncbi:hypothetical protein KKB18_00475, partial [bacterium]|nr:hypothetical protein [bacterium]
MKKSVISLLYISLLLLFLLSINQDFILHEFPSLKSTIEMGRVIKIMDIGKFLIFVIFFFLLIFRGEYQLKKSTTYILLAAIILIFFIHAFYFSPFTVDDAFISFQYAKNLALGNGLTFNTGERVEGYTNFLLVLIESLLYLVGLDLIFWIKTLSILAGAGIIILMYKLICLEIQNNNLVNLLPCLIVAVNSPFVLASTAGLETQLFSLAVFAGLYVFLKNDRTTGKILASLLLTISILIRPEGLIFFGILTIIELQNDLKSGNKAAFSAWLGTFSLIFIPYFIWRFSYFGELLPNTFHAKVGGDLFSRMIYGKNYVHSFLKTFNLRIFLFISIIQFFRNRLSKIGKILLLIVLIYFLYICYTGEDWIPQYRFIAPVIPIIFTLSYIGVFTLLKNMTLKLSPRIMIFLKIILIIHLAIFSSRTISLKNTEKMFTHIRMRAYGYEHAHKYLALWLRNNSPENSSVAMMDVGMIKFYSERYVIDITGLTEKFIAKSKGGLLNKDYDPSYIFDK